MRTGSGQNRLAACFGTLVVLVLCISGLQVTVAAAQQSQPHPPPETVPTFYDAAHMFDKDQLHILERDARLLQRSNIPTVVYVRASSSGEASVVRSRAFAEKVRSSWRVETTSGADDGLVLVLSYVVDDPQASTIVASWGESTFHGSGLTSEYIDSVLEGEVRSLLEDGRPYEALVHAMRRIRYGGIYFPPPPPPLEGSARALHNAINRVAPILVVGSTLSFVLLSSRHRPNQAMKRNLVWKVAGSTGALLAVLLTLSVIGQSRIGIGSGLLILVALGMYTWLWTHPSRSRTRQVRRCNVLPTRPLVRRRRHGRLMKPVGTRS